MKYLLTHHLYLLAAGGGVAALWMAGVLGLPQDGAVLAWSVTTLAAGVWLERAVPYHPPWREAKGDTVTDATSAAVLIGLVDPLLKTAIPLAAAALMPTARGGAPWLLATLPFALQVIAVVLWIELAKYWSHRAHHAMPGLWWLHAMHHGSERLYWLNNFRFHPLNHLGNTVVSMLPLAWTGAPHDVVLAALAFSQPVVMLQHLNARTSNGWQNLVFSTNELHRWHHSAEPAEAHSNFGSALVLWDRLFGTYRAATGRPARIGLFGNGSGYPARGGYLQQLFFLHTPACCRA